MKTIIVSMAIAMLCMCLQVNAGEKKAEIKWDMEYLDPRGRAKPDAVHSRGHLIGNPNATPFISTPAAS